MSVARVGKRQGRFLGYVWKDPLRSRSRTLGFSAAGTSRVMCYLTSTFLPPFH